MRLPDWETLTNGPEVIETDGMLAEKCFVVGGNAIRRLPCTLPSQVLWPEGTGLCPNENQNNTRSLVLRLTQFVL